MKPLLIRRTWDLVSRWFPRFACDVDLLRRNQNFEPDLWLVPKFCSPEARSIDVGANQGIYSRWMCRHSATVEAFECNPMLLKSLRSFLPGKATIHACALSDREQTLSLRFDPDNTGIGTVESRNQIGLSSESEQFETVAVPSKTLDSFQFENISFIKIDVEGHEEAVLIGAQKLLTQQGPALLIEIEERHCPGNLSSVPRFLGELGYHPFVLKKGDSDLSPIGELQEWAALGHINFWFLKDAGIDEPSCAES